MLLSNVTLPVLALPPLCAIHAPLPANTVLALPLRLIVAILPNPLIFATGTFAVANDVMVLADTCKVFAPLTTGNTELPVSVVVTGSWEIFTFAMFLFF
jgi:hypothetical protein